MRPLELVRMNDDLYEVLRDFNPVQFLTDPNSNKLNQKLIGMWVHHLGGDKAVRKMDKILICRLIEDATIIE
jgi:hypothetical protein